MPVIRFPCGFQGSFEELTAFQNLLTVGQPLDEILTVLVIRKNRCLFDSSNDEVVYGAGSIDPGLTWIGSRETIANERMSTIKDVPFPSQNHEVGIAND